MKSSALSIHILRMVAVLAYGIIVPWLLFPLTSKSGDIIFLGFFLMILFISLGFTTLFRSKLNSSQLITFTHLALAIIFATLYGNSLLRDDVDLDALLIFLAAPMMAVIFPAALTSHFSTRHSAPDKFGHNFQATIQSIFFGLIALFGLVYVYLEGAKLFGIIDNSIAIVFTLFLIAVIGIAFLLLGERLLKLPVSSLIVSFAIATALTCILFCWMWGSDEHGKTGPAVMTFFFAPYIFVFLPAAIGLTLWRFYKKSSPPRLGQAATHTA